MGKFMAGIILASSLLTPAAVQATNLVKNGSFENVGTASSSFAISAPEVLTDWVATPATNQFLDCLIMPGQTNNLCGGTTTYNPNGWTLAFWVNPGPSPDGGNFVGIDGSSTYATPITQTISGLTVGTTYRLSFYQASGQQSGFDGATTEQWQVSLGSDTQLSTLMNTPNHGSIGWMTQTMDFKASATSEVLKFLAVGTPSGVPPFVFLDGVSLTQVPEPDTWALIGGALLILALPRGLRKSDSSH